MKARPHHVVALPWSHSIIDEAFQEMSEPAPNDRDGDHVANGHGGNGHTVVPTVTVVKTEKFHAQPLSISDACMQLNLVNEVFLVFRNDTDGRVNVVYKREDGSYGLIETPAHAS